MKEWSSNNYKYAGKTYYFSINIYSNVAEKDIRYEDFLNENIQMFEYENTLNSLFLTASLIYVDKYGSVDKYINRQFVYCHVDHIMYETIADGNINVQRLSDTHRFQHNFFVTSIEILNRQTTEITYKIKMVSANWLNCAAYVNYTNYNQKPEDIFNIIQTLILSNNLTVDSDSFDKIKSDVQINYITNENDNLCSSINYLLNKLYYYYNTDSSIKFIFYDEINKRYKLFSLSDTYNKSDISPIQLSFFKSQTEEMFSAKRINFGTVTKLPKTKSFDTSFQRDIYNYDFSKNVFVTQNKSSESIILYKNERPDDTGEDYQNRFRTYTVKELAYKHADTYWNNNLTMYNDSVNVLNEDNALVITIDAQILKQPSDRILIIIDRNTLELLQSDDPMELDKVKNKYIGLDGIWTISRVRHIISPSTGQYLQNLILFRNFTYIP